MCSQNLGIVCGMKWNGIAENLNAWSQYPKEDLANQSVVRQVTGESICIQKRWPNMGIQTLLEH